MISQNLDLTPITYGDALWYGQKKSYILSGDVIMTALAKVLKPRLSIFVLNVDGVYSNMKSKKLIYDFKKEKPAISTNKMDVTGGMNTKDYRGYKNVQIRTQSVLCKRQQATKNYRCRLWKKV